MTPTGQTPTKQPGIISRFLRDDHPENPKVLVLWAASAVLIYSLASVAHSCSVWIRSNGDLGAGACWALGLAIFGLGLLAGYSIGAAVPFAPGAARSCGATQTPPEKDGSSADGGKPISSVEA